MADQTTGTCGDVAFTYSWYRGLLDRIREAGYDLRSFAEDPADGSVIVRHDVDLSLRDAHRLALLEAERDVSATYCVLLTSALYNPLEGRARELLEEIADLGHEIALHVSTHEYFDDEPPTEALEERIDTERAVLETVLEETVETVSFHAPPDWVLNRRLEGIRNAYGPAYFGEIDYVADSGQRWRDRPPTVADFGDRVQLLTHPGLWGGTDASFRDRIERSVARACRHAQNKARREFAPEGQAG